MEDVQVLKLAKAIWSRNRIDRYVQVKMQAKQNEISFTNKISHLVEKLKPLAPKFLEAKGVKEVEELLNKLEDPLGKQLIVGRWPLEKCDPASAWGSVIAQGLSSTVPEKRIEDDEEFLHMVDHFPIDEDYGTLERMDASIDRTLKRLMQLKTMKQMFHQLEPKLIIDHKGGVLI
jgi:predicted ribosome quality control (RQC) complex YloA/Tae2 family protein